MYESEVVLLQLEMIILVAHTANTYLFERRTLSSGTSRSPDSYTVPADHPIFQ